GQPAVPTESAALVNPAATGPTTSEGTPTEAVLESVTVTEAGPAPAPPSTNTPEKKAAESAEEETS
ncbi:transcriptional regulator, partial [Micromonospora azadirachtae]